jgi:hypothetical protein
VSLACHLRTASGSAIARQVIDWTKPHNWIGLAIAVLVIGFVWHQLGGRVPQVKGAVQAAYGA